MDDFLSLFAPIAGALKAHAYGTAATLTIFAVLNALFRLKTPAQWVVFLDGFPRVHAAMDVIRAFVQPVELIEALARIVTGKKPPTAGGVNGFSVLPPPLAASNEVPNTRRSGFYARVLPVYFAGLLCAIGCSGCTPQQGKTAVDVGTTIADDTCKILEQQPEPEWIILACAAEGVAGGIVKVKMPRALYMARHAAGMPRYSYDAGPGL